MKLTREYKKAYWSSVAWSTTYSTWTAWDWTRGSTL